MDTAQIVTIIVVLVLTGLLVATGFQFFKILGEFRKTVQKINKMLDDSGIVTETVAKSVTGFSGLGSGIKTALSVFNFFRRNPPSHKASAGKEDD